MLFILNALDVTEEAPEASTPPTPEEMRALVAWLKTQEFEAAAVVRRLQNLRSAPGDLATRQLTDDAVVAFGAFHRALQGVIVSIERGDPAGTLRGVADLVDSASRIQTLGGGIERLLDRYGISDTAVDYRGRIEPTPFPTPTAVRPAVQSGSDRGTKLAAGLVYRDLAADWIRNTPEIERLIPLAVQEGLVLFTTYDDVMGRAMCGAFTDQFPNIKCQNRSIGAAQIVATITAERDAGSRSVDVVGLAMSHIALLDDRGYLGEENWSALGVDPRRAWDANRSVKGNAVGFNNNHYTHFYNRSRVKAEDLPKDMFGFQDRKWKDKMCGDEFLFRAGQGFTSIYYDIDRVAAWGKDVIQNNGLVVTTTCNALILSGERPVYIFGYGNPPVLLTDTNIAQFWTPGMGVTLFSMATTTNAPHSAAARLFSAWATSKAASAITWRCCGAGWVGYGDAPQGIVSGPFGRELVYESTETFRDRIKWQTEFSARVFPGAG